ncbi:MAG: response regulator [Elusimicrobia bacterium]|nr:response regulator [Elusimicrobiota bacterium]
MIRWLEDRKMPSFKTGGGHRRVWEEDVVGFMKAHGIPVPPELAAGNRLRVLIVDDEAVNRRLIQKVIRKSLPEAAIEEASDGFEAGHKMNAFLPAIVILDLRLPGIDGLRVCRMIRAEDRFRGVKVLAITGYDFEDSKRRALASGADDFLGKPFEIGELAQKLAALAAAAR